MVADKIWGNINENSYQKEIVKIPFDWFELEKKRITKKAADGTEFGIGVDEMLKDGDILAVTADRVYAVEVLSAHLIGVHVESMEKMGRLCFELGNRHLSLRITENDVYVPYDEPTFEYLDKLGFQPEDMMGQFTDYIVCKAHEHSHSHGEKEQHEHEHKHNRQ